MGFCGKSGKRLWVKSDRHIIKPNHGVEQTPKIVLLKKFVFMNGFHFFRSFRFIPAHAHANR
jgi:hypothetical protein